MSIVSVTLIRYPKPISTANINRHPPLETCHSFLVQATQILTGDRSFYRITPLFASFAKPQTVPVSTMNFLSTYRFFWRACTHRLAVIKFQGAGWLPSRVAFPVFVMFRPFCLPSESLSMLDRLGPVPYLEFLLISIESYFLTRYFIFFWIFTKIQTIVYVVPIKKNATETLPYPVLFTDNKQLALNLCNTR